MKDLIAALLMRIEQHNQIVINLPDILSDSMVISDESLIFDYFGIPKEETDGDGEYLFCRDYLHNAWDDVDWSSVDGVTKFLDFLEKESVEAKKYLAKQKLKIVKIH